MTRTRSHSVSNEEISLIRNMIFDLQEDKEKLKKANHQLADQLQVRIYEPPPLAYAFQVAMGKV